jgi:hypothetical protein
MRIARAFPIARAFGRGALAAHQPLRCAALALSSARAPALLSRRLSSGLVGGGGLPTGPPAPSAAVAAIVEVSWVPLLHTHQRRKQLGVVALCDICQWEARSCH